MPDLALQALLHCCADPCDTLASDDVQLCEMGAGEMLDGPVPRCALGGGVGPREVQVAGEELELVCRGWAVPEVGLRAGVTHGATLVNLHVLEAARDGLTMTVVFSTVGEGVLEVDEHAWLFPLVGRVDECRTPRERVSVVRKDLVDKAREQRGTR